MFIRGRGKISYLTGAMVAPKEDDPTFQTWDSENSMVMTWLINSMDHEIGDTYLFLLTRKDI